jgi:hypothetical protein
LCLHSFCVYIDFVSALRPNRAAIAPVLMFLEEEYPNGVAGIGAAELLEAAASWADSRSLEAPGKTTLSAVLQAMPDRAIRKRSSKGVIYQLAAMTGLQGSEEGLALLLEAGAEPVVIEEGRLEGAPSRVPPAAFAPDTPPRLEGDPSRVPPVALTPDAPAEPVVIEEEVVHQPDNLGAAEPDPESLKQNEPAKPTETAGSDPVVVVEPTVPKPTPLPDDGILLSAPRPRPATVLVPEVVAPSYAGGVAGTPVEEASDEKKAEAAVAYRKQLKTTGQDNDDPLAYMPASAAKRIPADATTYPSRPAVQLLIAGREREDWRLVASRRTNLMLIDGAGERVAVCPASLVRIVEPTSKLDVAAASLAKLLNGVVIDDYQEPELVAVG